MNSVSIEYCFISLFDNWGCVLSSDSKSWYDDIDYRYDEYEHYYHIWKDWFGNVLKIGIPCQRNMQLLPFIMLAVFWLGWWFIDNPPMTKNKIPTRTCMQIKIRNSWISWIDCTRLLLSRKKKYYNMSPLYGSAEHFFVFVFKTAVGTWHFWYWVHPFLFSS